MHILIADDDPIYRDCLEGLLKDWRFEVTTTCNGQEAWDAFQRDRGIQLAILDWMMPEIDGYELCQRLKQERDNDIYIILLTSSRLKEEIIKVLIAGADDYIIKPFEAMDLKIRLRTAMRILSLEAEVAELRHPPGKQVKHEVPDSAERPRVPTQSAGA